MKRSNARRGLPCALLLLVPHLRAEEPAAAETAAQAAAREQNERESAAALEALVVELRGLYDLFEGRVLGDDSEELLLALRRMGDSLDEMEGHNVYELRTNLLAKLTPEQRQERLDARVRSIQFRARLHDALQSGQHDGLDEQEEALNELAQTFADWGDVEHEAYCLVAVARGRKATDRKPAAAALLAHVDQRISQAGYRNWAFHAEVKRQRAALLAEGHAGPRSGGGLLANLFAANAEAVLRKNRIQKAKHDSKAIADAIRLYANVHGRFPEALKALALPDPELFDEPYLDPASLIDPWSRPYLLVVKEDGQFEIVSYGADGVAGGGEENADLRFDATWTAR